jgi:hypothetical protein
MAQTRKRRRTKHRGNAAGMIETRGRTGRPPTPQERKADSKEAARLKREERLNRPPSWKGALNRAAISALVFVVLVLLVFQQTMVQALTLGAFMLLIYIPVGYYMDAFIYKRRTRKKPA